MSNLTNTSDLSAATANEDAAAEQALMKPILAQIKIGKASAFPAMRRAAIRLERRILAPAKRRRSTTNAA